MNNVCVMLAKQSFRGRTDAKPFLKLFASAVRYPGNLRCKAFNMILFFLKETFGNKHRHTDVFVAGILEHSVKNALNVLPDCVAVGADNHASLYACIFNKLCLFNDIGIPFGKVLFH